MGDQVRRGDRLIELLDPDEAFNYRHFRMRHMAAELLRGGLPPGSAAPEFTLSSTTGERLRLHDLRGRPVLLHFVSYTCPVTRGGIDAMRELHRLYGERIAFVEVLVRQAHPGERRGAYGTYERKRADAEDYAREESVPWTVLIDDIGSSVQRAYGGLAAAAYLIDARGTIAFCGTWGQSPALRRAMDQLLAPAIGGAPPVSGTDRRPHLAAAIVAGQRGPVAGGRLALLDLELGFPGAMVLMGLGRVMRPLLRPVAVRTTPLPAWARAVLLAALVLPPLAIAMHRRRLDALGRSRTS